MKTKKISYLAMFYGFSRYVLPLFIVVSSLFFLVSRHQSIPVVLIVVVVSALLLYLNNKLVIKVTDWIQKELLRQYENHLLFHIKGQREWKYFPTKQLIADWNATYLGHLVGIAQDVWITNFHVNHRNSDQWREVLKNVYIPIQSIYGYTEKGVPLYDIEVFESFTSFPKDTKDLNLEQKKLLLFLKHLPLEDIQSCLERSNCPCLNQTALSLILLREGDKEKFESFLEIVYSKKVEVDLTNDAITFLMKYAESIGSREKKDLSVAKPLLRKILLFLAYYVGIKAESIKSTERKKIFDWYLEQQSLYFVEETRLLLHWTTLTPEEIVIIRENVRDVNAMIIFANREIWEELSTQHLKQILIEFSSPQPVFSWIKEIKDVKRFLREISERLPNE